MNARSGALFSGRIRRFRRRRPKYTHAAIPAKAGISIRRKANPPFTLRAKEIPAFAGMAVFLSGGIPVK
ncbi:MAG: hypothetical protein ACR2QC_07065 [Gammaproteobacteria bacterium]